MNRLFSATCAFMFLLNNQAIAQCSGASIARSGAVLSVSIPMDSYQWVFCSDYRPVSSVEGFNAHYFVTADGDYTVIVKKATCTDTLDCISISGLGLEEFHTVPLVRLYPNPASTELQLQHQFSAGALNLRIYDLNGRLLLAQQLPAVHGEKISIPLSLPASCYLLHVADESGRHIRQLFRVE